MYLIVEILIFLVPNSAFEFNFTWEQARLREITKVFAKTETFFLTQFEKLSTKNQRAT